MSIILGKLSYKEALAKLNLETLESRRDKLCVNFARKSLKSRHKDMFGDHHEHDTRDKSKLYEQKYNHTRFYNSPLNYLKRLMNNE